MPHRYVGTDIAPSESKACLSRVTYLACCCCTGQLLAPALLTWSGRSERSQSGVAGRIQVLEGRMPAQHVLGVCRIQVCLPPQCMPSMDEACQATHCSTTMHMHSLYLMHDQGLDGTFAAKRMVWL